MNRLTNRIWIAAVLMALGWVCTTYVRSGYTFEVEPFKRGFDSLPLELDGYTGANQPIDQDVSKILNADETVNRQYLRPDGTSVLFYGSAWFRPDKNSQVAPHNPKICYVNAGWKILEERVISVNAPGGKLPIDLILLERDTDRCVVGFWYQMGQSTFLSNKEGRQLHRQFWGNKKWPATFKFMIQTPSQGIDAAIPRLEEFALIVYQWSLEL